MNTSIELHNGTKDWRVVPIANSTKVYTFTRQKTALKLPEFLQEELNSLNLPSGTILDGEIWSPMKRGGWDNLKAGQCKLTFWDVMKYGDKNTSNQPIEERRKMLAELIPVNTNNIERVTTYDVSLSNLQMLEHQARQIRDGQALRSGFIHGVVLKRNKSPRRDHACRSIEHPDWLKIVYQGLAGWEPR